MIEFTAGVLCGAFLTIMSLCAASVFIVSSKPTPKKAEPTETAYDYSDTPRVVVYPFWSQN